ncbi:MAG: M23 family metallopeptidase [bacterium]
MAGTLIAAVLISCAAFIGMLCYRSAYLGTESTRIQAAEFMRERASMLSRLQGLEESISRTERFAAKIESSAGIGRGDRVGQGPVDETESLPEMPSTSPLRLGEGMWKSPFSKALTAGLDLSLRKLTERNDAVEEKLHTVFSKQQDKLYFWSSLPSAWPTRGWVTSEFGDRRSWGGNHIHDGIDIAGPVGTPISAPGDGVVTFTGYKAGYGKAIIIDHGYGISTLYGHCSALYVDEGQRVKRGLLIAAVGSTGRSSGPHLHFEIHVDGVPVDPMLYLSNKM